MQRCAALAAVIAVAVTGCGRDEAPKPAAPAPAPVNSSPAESSPSEPAPAEPAPAAAGQAEGSGQPTETPATTPTVEDVIIPVRVGPDDVALVVSALSHPSPKTQEQALKVIMEAAENSTWEFSDIKPDDLTPVIEPVIAQLKNPSVDMRAMAAETLGHLQVKSAVDQLAVLVRTNEYPARESAVEALGAIGPDASPAVSAIVAIFDEPYGASRSAAEALAQIGAIDELLGLLQHEEMLARDYAASGLGTLQNADEKVIAGLVKLLHDTEAQVRQSAAKALGDVEPKSEVAATALKEALNDENERVRNQVAASLSEYPPEMAGSLKETLQSWWDEPGSRWDIGFNLTQEESNHGPLWEIVADEKNEPQIQAAALAVLSARHAVDANPHLDLVQGIVSDPDRPLVVRVRGALLLDGLQKEDPQIVTLLLQGVDTAIDQSTRKDAARALASACRREAIPVLIRNLKPVPDGLGADAAKVLGTFNSAAAPAIPALLDAFEDDAHDWRSEIISALASIGPPAAEAAVPVLLDELNSGGGFDGIEDDCMKALAVLAPDAPETLSALTAALDSTSAGVSRPACKALELLRHRARPALPRLIQHAQDPDSWIRDDAIDALMEVGTGEPEEMRVVLADCSSEFGFRVGQALRTIAKWRTAPEVAIPGLTKLLDDSPDNRLTIMEVLGAYGPAAGAAAPRIAELLAAPDNVTRDAAAAALRQIGQGAADAVPVLREHLQQQDDLELQRTAALALLSVAPADELLHSSLFSLFPTEDEWYPLEEAIRKLQGEANPTLLAGLRSEQPETRRVAAAMVASLDDVSPLVSDLEAALTDDDQQVRQSAAIALSQIGVDAEIRRKALPVLVELLVADGDSSWEISGAIDGFGAEAIPMLIDAVFDENNTLDVRISLLDQLETAGSEAGPVIPLLKSRVESEAEDERLMATLLLARLDPQGAETLPVLLSGLEHENDAVRRASLRAMSGLGPAAGSALPVLFDLSQQDSGADLLYEIGDVIRAIGPQEQQEQYVVKLLALLQDPTHSDWVINVVSGSSDMVEVALPELMQKFRSDDESERDSAAYALSVIGTPAVTPLVQMAAETDLPVEDRLRALEAVGYYYGEELTEAVELLKTLLEDSDTTIRLRAAITLANLDGYDSRAVPTLIAGILDGDDSAADALRQFQQEAQAFVPRLARLSLYENLAKAKTFLDIAASIDPESPVLIEAAVSHIERSGPLNESDELTWTISQLEKPIIARLVPLVTSVNRTRRQMAAEALATCSAVDPDAADALKVTLTLIDADVGVMVARAVTRHDSNASEAIPFLKDGLQSRDASTRRHATAGLASLGSAARDALPELIAAIENDDIGGRAIDVLGQIGPEAVVAVPDLVKALRNRRLAYSAARALGEIGPTAAQAIPDLVAALSHPQTQGVAVEALAKMGPQAAIAVPVVMADLEDPYRRMDAVYNLASLSSVSDEALTRVLELAQTDADVSTRRTALRSLRRSEKLTAAAMPMLLELVGEQELPDDEELAVAAIGATGAAGPDAADAVAPLMNHLSDDSTEIRAATVRALGEIGEAAAPAVSALTALLDDDELRYDAVRTLKRIGPAANAALPRLGELEQQSQDDDFVEAIRDAVRGISSADPES